ncbi:ROK family protein [Planctomycetota bacterium]|nr:ROK family protein [Planctomycetota bacterium]
MKIGVDWGGTSIKVGVVDGQEVTANATAPTVGTPAEILDSIAKAVQGMVEKLDGVGLAIPGEVKPDGRCWRLPNVAGFEDIQIAIELSSRLGCPVTVENDATAAALAERLFGWGQRYKSFLLVTLGTGVGGGLVLDGNIRRGRGGFAGEIGHVLVDSSDDARKCGCGNRGCLEAYAGTAGLLGLENRLGGNAKNVKQALEGPHMQVVLAQLGETLGCALASINNTLDLDAIVFTGGVAGSFDRTRPLIEKSLAEHSFSAALANIPLLQSQLGEHAGVIGAAYLPQKSERESSSGGTTIFNFDGPKFTDDELL